MILEKCECIIFDSVVEAKECFSILEQHGYRFWSGYPLSGASSHGGIRWFYNSDYPNCCATMNSMMARCVRINGTVDEGNHHYVSYSVLTYDEFLDRLNGVCAVPVEDLI